MTTLKPLTMCITTNCGKFLKRWEYQTTLPASCKTCMQVKKQQLEPNVEQETGFKLGKEYIKAVYCHPAYLACMQSTSCEMPGWMNHRLESRLPGKIAKTISSGSWKKQESSRNISISALLTMPKPLTVWITINCGKF